jgi:Delta7-sterol 5-desaturase
MDLNGFTFYQVWGFVFGITYLRYLIFAGFVFLLCWVWKREAWKHRRVQIEYPDKSKLWNEFKYSTITMFIFATVGMGIFLATSKGYTKIYKNFDDYGAPYFFSSIICMILLHDTYFYWTHKLMHHKLLFKYVHKVHHNSTNPSPWAAFSFHPAEAIVEAGILPLIVFLMPVHRYAIVTFLLYMTLMNVFGHNGFELYRSGFTRNWWTSWSNTPTHHNMHHKYFNCNYGLYFNWWDKWMNTNHEKYHETFEAIQARSPAIKVEVSKTGQETFVT